MEKRRYSCRFTDSPFRRFSVSNHTGQTVTEFILMLAFMTIIGIYLMSTLIGGNSQGGAVNTMTEKTTSNIAVDEP